MNDDDETQGFRELERRLGQLTRGQQLCLWLVLEHRSSKEIARQLGISRHTVDQRIRAALKTLGVRRRSQAARLLRSGLVPPDRSRALLPFSTRRHPLNDMAVLTKLFWIAGISIGAAFTAGILLAAAEAWEKLFEH